MKTLCAIAFLTILAPTPATSQSCSGCEGDGGQATDSSPNCGSVGISILVPPGDCGWYIHTETGQIECKMASKCLVSITRKWNGVPANTEMGFCVTQSGLTRCLVPPPSSGSGTGSATGTWQLSCGDGYYWSINIECPSGGGLFAGADGECSECPG